MTTLLLLVACAPDVDLNLNPPANHVDLGLGYERAEAARDAVIRGAPGEVLDHLRTLWVEANQIYPDDDDQAAAQRELVSAVETGLHSSNFAGLAQGVAATGAACGGCHADAGAKLDRGSATPPEDGSMRRHYWGIDRIWYGLVAADTGAVQEGFTVIAKTRLVPDRPEDPAILTKARHLEVQVNQLAATVASEGSSDAARVQAYGQLLETCSTCHAWAGGGPPKWVGEPGAAQPDAAQPEAGDPDAAGSEGE
ncbi:MAG: hypothetical protein H6739_09325 [Alphaproteobacteria bacterium]|nr:hypothetical protein [Alphaproteobacteria bacterium]